MKNSRRRIGKSNGVLGIICGVIFELIGLFVVIPTFGGAFGKLWTLIAAVITAYGLYAVFGKKYVGPEISIEEEGDDMPPSEKKNVSAQEHLTELRALYDQRLITQEEYEEKRRQILKEL